MRIESLSYAEIANKVAFIESDQANYVNRADVQVDGGVAQV